MCHRLSDTELKGWVQGLDRLVDGCRERGAIHVTGWVGQGMWAAAGALATGLGCPFGFAGLVCGSIVKSHSMQALA